MNIEKELLQIQENVIDMAKQVIHHHQKLMKAISEKSQEQALMVIQEDEYINRKEEEINDIAQRALALLTPVARDLRVILASIKIAIELERIADYAKNIARQFIKNHDIFTSIYDECMKIEEYILKMLLDSMEAYEHDYIDLCFDIIHEDEMIHLLIQDCHIRFVDNHQYSRSDLFLFASILRSLERSGDHVKNICEHILYMVKGQHYDFG